MTPTRSFVVVDDQPLFRKGVIDLLQQDPSFRVVGEAGTIAAALELLTRVVPDTLLVEINLAGQNGLDLVRLVRRRYPRVRQLVMSTREERYYAHRALRSGAQGYVMKTVAPEVVMRAVRRVHQGQNCFPLDSPGPEPTGRPQENIDPSSLLSPREFEVLRAIGSGFSLGDIAEQLGVTVKTVNTYRDHIKEKLGVESASEVRRIAFQWVHENS